ncbi:MAG: three-Cys-motif partner protein TcmP [Planctomycetes bacterium]|nr:three-Cys-motif partner protein TcmP [Planctomycetota bacterium]
MATNEFFDEQTEQSLVKSSIVSKYFWAWAKVITKSGRGKQIGKIAYIDLFAGPGRYKDESDSTPLMVLKKAIADPTMAKMLVTIFNDKDEQNTKSLEKSINELPGVEKLTHKPKVHNQEVGPGVVADFEKMKLVPTLMFVDPWGYKGLSLKLVNSVIKDWACECLFFFNYRRINMGMNNEYVQEPIDQLFGEERAAKLRPRLEGLTPAEREVEIIEQLCIALQEMGGKFVLPFRFKDKSGKQTSHHLVFVSKHPLGYTIMKGIMAYASSSDQQGVASFEYNRASVKQQFLFGLNRPLDKLEDDLLERFAGRSLTMEQVFEQHNVGTPFVEKNYKDALAKLEAKGKITADPPAVATPGKKARRKGTFAGSVRVSFPKKG